MESIIIVISSVLVCSELCAQVNVLTPVAKYLFSDVKGVCAQFSEGEALFAPHSFGDWTYANDREHESACACGEKNTERHSEYPSANVTYI